MARIPKRFLRIMLSGGLVLTLLVPLNHPRDPKTFPGAAASPRQTSLKSPQKRPGSVNRGIPSPIQPARPKEQRSGESAPLIASRHHATPSFGNPAHDGVPAGAKKTAPLIPAQKITATPEPDRNLLPANSGGTSEERGPNVIAPAPDSQAKDTAAITVPDNTARRRPDTTNPAAASNGTAPPSLSGNITAQPSRESRFKIISDFQSLGFGYEVLRWREVSLDLLVATTNAGIGISYPLNEWVHLGIENTYQYNHSEQQIRVFVSFPLPSN